MDEREIIDMLTMAVRQALESCGLEVFGPVAVHLYQRWDHRNADVTINAKVAPRL